MTGLADDIARVMTKALAEIKKLSDEELKAFLTGEGSIRYVPPGYQVKAPAPAKAPTGRKAATEPPVTAAEVDARLRGVASELEAEEYLKGLNLKLAQVKALAAELGVPTSGRTGKAVVGDIVKVKVAGRLATEAIGRY